MKTVMNIYSVTLHSGTRPVQLFKVLVVAESDNEALSLSEKWCRKYHDDKATAAHIWRINEPCVYHMDVTRTLEVSTEEEILKAVEMPCKP